MKKCGKKRNKDACKVRETVYSRNLDSESIRKLAHVLYIRRNAKIQGGITE